MNSRDLIPKNVAAEIQSKVLQAMLLNRLRRNSDSAPLSSKGIIILISQHLACKRSKRLPVLLVEAVYQAVEGRLGQSTPPLKAYVLPGKQTDAQGVIEVSLVNGEGVHTVIEMTRRPVTRDDIDDALAKIAHSYPRIDNYLFVTTDVIDEDVRAYAASLYEETGGTEVAVLDCIGFIRHFLHLFHRSRTAFLNAYQELVLGEPDSAVSAALKEAFLVLRHAAESGE